MVVAGYNTAFQGGGGERGKVHGVIKPDKKSCTDRVEGYNSLAKNWTGVPAPISRPLYSSTSLYPPRFEQLVWAGIVCRLFLEVFVRVPRRNTWASTCLLVVILTVIGVMWAENEQIFST